jgi:SSS family solute:Na+ symporter
VVFYFGVFWKRLNASGCLWAMIIGFILGLFRMGIDTVVTMGVVKGGFEPGSWMWIINHVNFQYFSILITAASAVTMIVVSYATPAPDYARLKGLTFATTTDAERAETRASWSKKEVVFSCCILACILATYLYFTG